MTINFISSAKNPAVKVFRLDNLPSVLDPSDGKTTFNNTHEANAKGSPSVAAIFIRFAKHVKSVEIAAIAGVNQNQKVDLVAVTFKNPENWVEISPEAVSQLLQERLDERGTLLIAPDPRPASQISIDDIRKSIKMYRPETVVVDNGDNADKAISVPDDGWRPETKTLTCVFDQACVSGKCGDISKRATQHMLHKHLLARYPGMIVNFSDRQP